MGENGTGERGDGVPTSKDWEAIREAWPCLAERSDEELASAVPMLRANRPDFRTLK